MNRLLLRLSFYPTLAWNVLLHRLAPGRRWWDRIDERVLFGAMPFASDVPALQKEGVRAVVNMCEEYPGPLAAYASAGIEQLHLPTPDFTPPRLEDLERGVAFMRERVSQGEGVYVHCKAGRGRSATLVLCWLVAAKGLTPERAQALLLEKRPHVSRRLWQREVVQDFARKWTPGKT